MARYRLLVDHYIGQTYFQAGTVVDDITGQIPSNWPPTPACDPTDADAIQKFFNAGPRGQTDAEPSRSIGPWFSGARWTGIPIGPPAVYWVRVGSRFQLSGAGASLGPHDP